MRSDFPLDFCGKTERFHPVIDFEILQVVLVTYGRIDIGRIEPHTLGKFIAKENRIEPGNIHHGVLGGIFWLLRHATHRLCVCRLRHFCHRNGICVESELNRIDLHLPARKISPTEKIVDRRTASHAIPGFATGRSFNRRHSIARQRRSTRRIAVVTFNRFDIDGIPAGRTGGKECGKQTRKC